MSCAWIKVICSLFRTFNRSPFLLVRKPGSAEDDSAVMEAGNNRHRDIVAVTISVTAAQQWRQAAVLPVWFWIYI